MELWARPTSFILINCPRDEHNRIFVSLTRRMSNYVSGETIFVYIINEWQAYLEHSRLEKRIKHPLYALQHMYIWLNENI